MRAFEFLCLLKIAVAAAVSNVHVNLHNSRFMSQAWQMHHYGRSARLGENEEKHPLPSRPMLCLACLKKCMLATGVTFAFVAHFAPWTPIGTTGVYERIDGSIPN